MRNVKYRKVELIFVFFVSGLIKIYLIILNISKVRDLEIKCCYILCSLNVRINANCFSFQEADFYLEFMRNIKYRKVELIFVSIRVDQVENKGALNLHNFFCSDKIVNTDLEIKCCYILCYVH